MRSKRGAKRTPEVVEGSTKKAVSQVCETANSFKNLVKCSRK
jgi:hypothetical protein